MGIDQVFSEGEGHNNLECCMGIDCTANSAAYPGEGWCVYHLERPLFLTDTVLRFAVLLLLHSEFGLVVKLSCLAWTTVILCN